MANGYPSDFISLRNDQIISTQELARHLPSHEQMKSISGRQDGQLFALPCHAFQAPDCYVSPVGFRRVVRFSFPSVRWRWGWLLLLLPTEVMLKFADLSAIGCRFGGRGSLGCWVERCFDWEAIEERMAVRG